MESLKLTHLIAPTRSLPGVAAVPQAASRAIGREEADVCTGVFDGLRWTYCEPAPGLLHRVSSQAWTQPESQGWTLVKHNGPRDVFRAEIDGRAYYLKYYREKRWIERLPPVLRKPACQAEWESGLYARRCGIPAAIPIAFTHQLVRRGRRCALLVTEAIEPAHALDDLWSAIQRDRDARRRRDDTLHLIDVLAQAIAHAHQSGFEHLDMHAANILVRPIAPRRYEAAFIDLQSARLDTPVMDHAVVRNLAQLNQWFRRHSSVADRVRFLRAYVRWRHTFELSLRHARPLTLGFAELFRALVAAADRHADRLWARRDRRSLRDGRYFARLKIAGWRGLASVQCKHPRDESPASGMVLPRAWWREQLADPLQWFRQAEALAKNSHSAFVARATLDAPDGPLDVIIKRPRARNWRRRLRMLLPPARSERGWTIGYALLNRDVPAARPLAYLVRRVGGLVVDSLLVTEALHGAVDLAAYLRRLHAQQGKRGWLEQRRSLLAALVRHLRTLHDRGFEHRDCKAENILVLPGVDPRLVWIDMDGIVPRRRVDDSRRLRALTRLFVSTCDAPGVTRSERARFLKSYLCRYGSDPRQWRSAWRQIAADAAKKSAAREARRAWKLAHYGRE